MRRCGREALKDPRRCRLARIAEGEWLLELARLSSKNAEGKTAEEWAGASGRSVHYIQAMLKKAKASGWLVVGKSTRIGLDDRTYQATVYRVVKPGKK